MPDRKITITVNEFMDFNIEYEGEWQNFEIIGIGRSLTIQAEEMERAVWAKDIAPAQPQEESPDANQSK